MRVNVEGGEFTSSTLTGSGAASNCADALVLKELKI